MLTYWPARPTWRAETTLQALVQLGFSPPEAEAVLAANVVDQNERCIFLNRDDTTHRCDVVIVNDGGTGIDSVFVLECHLDLGADSFDEPVANWPSNGSLWVVASNVVSRRAS